MIRLRLALILACFTALPLVRAQSEKFSPDDLDFVEQNYPTAKKTNTGIRYIIEREGTGKSPEPGDVVNVLYVGKLLNGKVFDKDLDPAHPFSFRVRRFQVIEGWEQTLQLMKVGEKRLVIIPSEYAYGTRGQPPTIPPDAPLIFEIELLSFK